MGSIDVELMKRIVAVIAQTPHKYIVSKGLRADEYQLPANCWGQAFLPQTSILPMVDLVITHGGKLVFGFCWKNDVNFVFACSNTTTETFSYGKPMIVMPLFADQWDFHPFYNPKLNQHFPYKNRYDNAQRIEDKGFGIRLEPYSFEPSALISSINQLLGNTEMQQKCKAAAARIQTSPSKELVCKRIEQVVAKFRADKK